MLEIDWKHIDVNNFALSELFAEAMESKLCTLKQRVNDMKRISFDRGDVEHIMCQAERWLKMAVEQCGSEQDLASGDCADIELLIRRSRWPYAEYSCKFLDNGDLVPAEYVIVNCEGKEFYSRRGLRECGWLARDRFCRVTNSFDVSEKLIDWISSKPILCGREYTFLLAKGVGGDMKVW